MKNGINFESNGKVSKYPLELDLLDENGKEYEFFIIEDGVKTKISLVEMVDYQNQIVKSDINSSISKHYTQNTNSEVNTKNVIIGDGIKNTSSGNFTKNLSYGNDTQNTSSGHYTRNASCGHYTRNASSGVCTRNTSSGHYTVNVSCGHYTVNTSSGVYTQNASGGNNSQNINSGNFTRNASSGHYTRNVSCGHYTVNTSSGRYTRNIILGKNSICFDCGFNSIIKGVNGTWISLAEYEINEKDILVPLFALSAQIGNPNYTDNNGEMLKENTYYCLLNKQFHEVDISDGIQVVVLKTEKFKDLKIIKGKTFTKNQIDTFVVTNGTISAHGSTKKKAIEDFKIKLKKLKLNKK